MRSLWSTLGADVVRPGAHPRSGLGDLEGDLWHRHRALGCARQGAGPAGLAAAWGHEEAHPCLRWRHQPGVSAAGVAGRGGARLRAPGVHRRQAAPWRHHRERHSPSGEGARGAWERPPDRGLCSCRRSDRARRDATHVFAQFHELRSVGAADHAAVDSAPSLSAQRGCAAEGRAEPRRCSVRTNERRIRQSSLNESAAHATRTSRGGVLPRRSMAQAASLDRMFRTVTH